MGRLLAVLGLAVASSVAGCFDSDDKLELAHATTTGLPSTTTSVDPSTTSSSTTTMPHPDMTCQDAITCVFQCAIDLQLMPTPEPDLACFLECIEVLTPDEAVKLIRLANCASELCAAEMMCSPNDLSTTGGSSSSTGDDTTSSTGEGTTGTGSSTSTGEPPLIDPCLECIFGKLLEDNTPGCEEFAMECT
ncbi:MAG TPA: hypothetical protein VFG69_09595 [Nannocystaceae bacterium]|nr:hypothetical protein [Nannocystaceae bacterium]